MENAAGSGTHARFHRSEDALRNGVQRLDLPRERGRLDAIVIRPSAGTRQVLQESVLSRELGVTGDRWAAHCWMSLPDGRPDPAVQVSLINAAILDLIAGSRERWPLAGDNLIVDLDLAEDHLPVGSKLAIGTAVIEITSVPHTGCRKFAERFGQAATRMVNARVARVRRLRGVFARILDQGTIRTGDPVSRLP